MALFSRRGILTLVLMAGGAFPTFAAADRKAERFHEEIEPLLDQYCLDCHGNGLKKGGVELDAFADDASIVRDRALWRAVLRNVRAGIMPPPKKPRPTIEETRKLADWIKRDVFEIDPADPDPGRVTIRRLNRIEYRRTIKDLLGIDYNTVEEFPPDDTGYGFDTIGEVLNVSPLLLEKYAKAAESIVESAVPTVSKVVRSSNIKGGGFRLAGDRSSGERFSFYKRGELSGTFRTERTGDYRIEMETEVFGGFDFDPGRCRLSIRDGDELVLTRELAWSDHKLDAFGFERRWSAGEHRLSFEIEPLEPIDKQKHPLELRIGPVRLIGPLSKEDWVHPPNYERFFFLDEPPAREPERSAYARQVLKRFAVKAFRRPVADATVERFAKFAESTYSSPGKTFEEGIARGIMVMLASPRFLFRLEGEEPLRGSDRYPYVDEYALASRLSYFLWSTMPDDELFRLAERGELRKNLRPQVDRMLRDPRSSALVENFTGQWLQLRDVEGVQIDAREVLKREGIFPPRRIPGKRPGFGFFLDPETRRAMRKETELCVDRVMRENRSLLEWIDADYTYLNETLARYYQIDGVKGNEMRLVPLPKDGFRGGVLTHGSILTVTSNPTRTSPVKRGLFILDNLLGMPPPPPPADIPTLEESEKEFKGAEPTMRQIMEIHRAKPLCSSCHSRMDPLGLALENFNALGRYRERERGKPIDASGVLISGEPFRDVRDLKRLIVREHRADFYRCVAEKLLTYASGRGIEAEDAESIDRIVEKLEADQGRFQILLYGIVESTPFQKRRSVGLGRESAGNGRPSSSSSSPSVLNRPSTSRGPYHEHD